MGPGPLVVSIIVNYCCTQKKWKETETEETIGIGFLWYFYHWWYFNRWLGEAGPLGTPMVLSKTWFCWLDNPAIKLTWPFLPFVSFLLCPRAQGIDAMETLYEQGGGGQLLGVVKNEPSLFFWQLCNLCMSAHAFSPLRSKLFPRSSPNPNECTHERSKSARTLIHELQRFGNKADGLSVFPISAKKCEIFSSIFALKFCEFRRFLTPKTVDSCGSQRLALMCRTKCIENLQNSDKGLFFLRST